MRIFVVSPSLRWGTASTYPKMNRNTPRSGMPNPLASTTNPPLSALFVGKGKENPSPSSPYVGLVVDTPIKLIVRDYLTSHRI